MSEIQILSQIPFLELTIPAWQMAFYVLIITVCMLFERHRVALLTSYLFTLYWGFFLYFGDVISSFVAFPNTATLYILCGLLHLTLTLVAFLKEA